MRRKKKTTRSHQKDRYINENFHHFIIMNIVIRFDKTNTIR